MTDTPRPPTRTLGDEALDDGGDDGFEPWLEELAAAPPIEPARTGPLRAGAVMDARYRIEDKLGAGGMGVVYRAWDLELERPVALKLHVLGMTEVAITRLWREAKVMARLNHPNVVTVYEVGTFGGRVFIAMEYIAGGTLRQWLKASPRRPPEILDMFVAAARGLVAAHALGIVHRDFKPDNVLVGEDGRPRVGDFGVARGIDDVAPEPAAAPATDERSGGSISQRLTATGSAVGTPAYMAPEQIRGQVDARSDQFAFCVSLYEALAGRRPFEGSDLVDLDLAIEAGRIPPLPRTVPRRVARALERGMQFEPARRFPDMASLVAAIAPPPSRTRGRVALAVTAGLGLAAIVWREQVREDPCRSARDRSTLLSDDEAAALEQVFVAADRVAEGERVVAALRGRAAAIADMRGEACEAALVRGHQSAALFDRRMVCLRQHADRLLAARDVLRQGDDATLDRALDIVESLEPPDACADEARLLAGVAPPSSAAQADAVAVAREALARTDVLMTAGHMREADEAAARELERARAIDYPPLLAEALTMRGFAAASMLRTDEAEADLREGFYLALQLGHDAAMADAASLLIGRVAARAGSEPEVDGWHRIALAAFDRVGASTARRVALTTSRAHADWVAGDLALAEAHAREALADAAALDRDDRARRLAAAMAARILTQRGELREALELQRGAWESAIRSRGATHPDVASSAEAMGETLLELGEAGDAQALIRSALAIRRASYGDDALPVAETASALGSALAAGGDPAAAVVAFDEALAIVERQSPDDAQTLARIANNKTHPLLALGQLDRAEHSARRGVELSQRGFGREHFQTGLAQATLASVLRIRGQRVAAVQEFERAIEILERSLGGQHWMTIAGRIELAASHVDAGEHARALAQLEALRVDAFALGAARWRGLWWLVDANALAAAQRYAEADRAFAEAAAVLDGHDGDDDNRTQLWLGWGATRLALDRPRDAGEAYRRAIEALSRSAHDPHELARARAGLARAEHADGHPDEARTLARQASEGLDADEREALTAALGGSIESP